jgi:hypothetical protein
MKVRKQIYRGSVIVYRQVTGMVEMCEMFAEFLKNTKDKNNIEKCREFEANSKISYLWQEIIHTCGVHHYGESSVLWDRVRLRIQTPASEPDDVTSIVNSTGRFSCSLPIHRDTWASNVYQQINWWAPLLPLTENATLAIYPSYFKSPVPNSSARWSLNDLKTSRSVKKPYPQLPVLETKSMSEIEQQRLLHDQVAVTIDPGDVLLFSGAHLHGSIANGLATSNRYSTEVRTVDNRDVQSGLGAPNIDGDAVGQQLQWFSPALDSDVSYRLRFEQCEFRAKEFFIK